MEEDFEDLYADDLEVMRELEIDLQVQQEPPGNNKKHKNQSAASKLANSQTFNGKSSEPNPPVSQSDPIVALNRNSRVFQSSMTLDKEVPALGEKEDARKSKKRAVEEMFGPLSDSEDELVIDEQLPTLAPTAKRARKLFSDDKTVDDSAITTPPPSPTTAEERIFLKVRHHREQITPSCQDTNQTTGPAAEQSRNMPTARRRMQVLLREPPGLSSRITGQDGKRVYLRMNEVTSVRGKMKKSVFKTPSGGPLRLLATSVDIMRDELEDERHERLMLAAGAIATSLEKNNGKNLSNSTCNDAVDEMDNDAGDVGAKDDKDKSSALWVDEYAPRRYTDLLSDDGINRNLLFWLKLWDTLVFGLERKQRRKPPQQQQYQQHSEAKGGKTFKSKFQQEEILEEIDDSNRPVHKVALLCGPPGLGKTTLAHIIAKHAGYNVVEMNASDDRSVELFRNKLTMSTQMKSVLSNDKRPNCLVIDEIDGAPAPAINCLLAFIKGASDSSAPESAASKKKKAKLLLRPIICICNDPYVPALRLLRQVAYVTHFPSTLTTRLASRLHQIAKGNAIRTDMTALMALCSKADNDIRSCLNTLQFIHSQGTSLSLGLVHSLSIGQKDKHKSFFAVWQEIFKLPRPKRKQYANPHDVAAGTATLDNTSQEKTTTSMTARFYNVLKLTQGAGDYDKLMQGIFENYLEMKFKDPRLDAVNLACDWLIFHDHLSSVVSRTQNYSYYAYLPFTPVLFHLLFASTAQPRLKYPNTAYENSMKQSRVQNLLTTVLTEVSPSTACFLNPRTAVLQILPLLLIILQPTFRPVNTQLFNAQEKRHMKELINTMIAYNVTYNQERSAEGQYNYALDPNLESIVRFSTTPTTKPMTYAAKQLIAREISLEKMRRSESALSRSNGPGDRPKPSETSHAKGKKSQPTVPRHLEKLQPKKMAASEPERPTRDFFGRIIQKKSPKPKTDTGKDGDASDEPAPSQKQASRQEQDHLSSKLWYKFNQGFTNAIRKKVRIQDLM